MAAGVAAVVLVVAVALVVVRQRQQEWAHGGDDLAVEVDMMLADQRSFDGAVAGFGVPAGVLTRNVAVPQSVVVRIRWSGSAEPDGRFTLVMADSRLTPPKPLRAMAAWTEAGGPDGFHWEGIYELLSGRYDWMQGFASAESPSAVNAGSGRSGMAVASFSQRDPSAIPFTDPAGQIAVGLIRIDADNSVRWARRVHR